MSKPRSISALALFLSAFVGCSSADFGVSNPELDAGGDDASLDTASRDGEPADTFAPDATDPPDTFAPDVPADDAAGDAAGDVAADEADAADATPIDTCSPNACGGCRALAQTPGGACGACGTLVCGADKESVACSDPGKNACGGCRSLSQTPGAACGSCGTLACGADGDSLTCNDPGKNACNGCKPLAAKPSDPCGVGCGGGTYQCNGTDALDCKGATIANACGGCSALLHALGSVCGVCNGGTYVCDPSNNNAVICNDPVTTPAPGTACGTCHTLTYACSTDNKTTACRGGDDANACGGCGTLTPALDSSCGICGGSKYVCDGATKGVTCQTPDDRTNLVAPSQLTAKLYSGYAADRITSLAIPFTTTKKSTRIASVALTLARREYGCSWDGSYSTCRSSDPECSCVCVDTVPAVTCTPTVTGANSITLKLFKGTPGVSGAVLLETVTSVTPTAVPTFVVAAPAPVTFPFSGDHNLPAGTPLYVELSVTGASWDYVAYGDNTLTSTSVRLTVETRGAVVVTAFAPYIVVTNYNCP